jgi:hypothetical protein
MLVSVLQLTWSHAHPAVDRQPGAGDEPGRVADLVRVLTRVVCVPAPTPA